MANINFVVKNDIELKGNLIFEGTTQNSFETTLAITDPTSDRTITFPNSTGTVALTSDLSSYLTASTASTTYALKNSDSQSNTKLGSNSLNNISSGSNNTNLGHNSGISLTQGQGNVGVGYGSIQDATTGDANVGVGYGSVGGNGSSNIGVGYKALSGISGGSQNLGLGYYAGTYLGTGSYNVVIGGNTGSSVEDTDNNIIISDGQGNIRIQADSGGRVTMPSQPAFNVTYTDGSVTFGAGVIVFNSARTNVGSHYSTSTGRFTAPVAGHYHFDVHFFKYTSYTNPSNTYWGFRVNGGATVTTNHGAQGSDGGQSLSTTIYLNANDYIDVYAQNTIQSWGGQFLQFSGFLIG